MDGFNSILATAEFWVIELSESGLEVSRLKQTGGVRGAKDPSHSVKL